MLSIPTPTGAGCDHWAVGFGERLRALDRRFLGVPKPSARVSAPRQRHRAGRQEIVFLGITAVAFTAVLAMEAATGTLHAATHGCVDFGYKCTPNWAYNVVYPVAVIDAIVYGIMWRLWWPPSLRGQRKGDAKDRPDGD